MPRRTALVGLSLALLAPSAFALADPLDTPATVPETPGGNLSKNWTVGLGVGYAPDYEGAKDYRAVPLWNIAVRDLYGPTTNVRLFGPQLLSNLLPDPNWRLGVAAQYIPDYDNVDDNDVQHLRGVDDTFLLGLIGGYDYRPDSRQTFSFDVSWRADVLNGNGWLLNFGPRYTVNLDQNKWNVSGGVLATYASENYMENYFNVSARDQQRTGLSQYSADASFKDVSFNLLVTYAIDESWSITGIGQFKEMVGDAADSPVVDDAGSKAQGFGGLLLNYSF